VRADGLHGEQGVPQAKLGATQRVRRFEQRDLDPEAQTVGDVAVIERGAVRHGLQGDHDRLLGAPVQHVPGSRNDPVPLVNERGREPRCQFTQV
jgi:hypothetical protein